MSRSKLYSKKMYEKLLTDSDPEQYWDYIRALRSKPDEVVFKRAIELTKSSIPKEKIIGIDVLAQLGSEPRPFLAETIFRYFEMISEEKYPDVLASLFYAIGHNNGQLKSEEISKLSKFKKHNNVEVRQGLVSALLGIENHKAIETLIELSEDKIASIRNWATFGLGSQIEISNNEILEALWKRTTDSDQETKFEAIVGLSNRGENMVKKIIIAELEEGEYGTLLFDAIETLRDSAFIPYLEKNLADASKDESVSKDWVLGLEECIKTLKKY